MPSPGSWPRMVAKLSPATVPADVRAVVLRVPLVVRDAARALVRPRGSRPPAPCAARGSMTVPPLHSLRGGRPFAGVAEVAHVGVDAGVEDADHLALAEDPAAEDRRRLPADEARLADPDRGVVQQHLARLRLHPEDLGDLRQGLARARRSRRASAAGGCARRTGSAASRRRPSTPFCPSSSTTRARSASGYTCSMTMIGCGFASAASRGDRGHVARDLVERVVGAGPGGAERRRGAPRGRASRPCGPGTRSSAGRCRSGARRRRARACLRGGHRRRGTSRGRTRRRACPRPRAALRGRPAGAPRRSRASSARRHRAPAWPRTRSRRPGGPPRRMLLERARCRSCRFSSCPAILTPPRAAEKRGAGQPR